MHRKNAQPAGSAEAESPGAHTRTAVAMDTLVTLRADTAKPPAAAEEAFDRAMHWFAAVERACNRFDPDSELSLLCSRVGEAVPSGAILCEAVAFAIEVARLTNGAFDPTIGARQQRRGFARNYLTGQIEVELDDGAGATASYRDVHVDRERCTITLSNPLLLDLGAVAKGLAIDLAARELAGFERYAVDAGGDLYAGGAAPAWRVGIPHPRQDGALCCIVEVENGAVCSSGDYERPADEEGEHHLLDPRTGRSPREVIAVTVAAPTAIVADALATAAFVLGPQRGLQLLVQQGVDGLIMTAQDERLITPGFEQRLTWQPE